MGLLLRCFKSRYSIFYDNVFEELIPLIGFRIYVLHSINSSKIRRKKESIHFLDDIIWIPVDL